MLNGFGSASYYIWREPENILIYADLPGFGKMAFFLARDMSNEYEVLQPDFFAFDGHSSYSPEKNFILYDSYPEYSGCYEHQLTGFILLHLRLRGNGRWSAESENQNPYKSVKQRRK